MAAITEASNSNQIAPSPKTLLQAARMAIELDKPICLDYYVASYNKNFLYSFFIYKVFSAEYSKELLSFQLSQEQLIF